MGGVAGPDVRRSRPPWRRSWAGATRDRASGAAPVHPAAGGRATDRYRAPRPDWPATGRRRAAPRPGSRSGTGPASVGPRAAPGAGRSRPSAGAHPPPWRDGPGPARPRSQSSTAASRSSRSRVASSWTNTWPAKSARASPRHRPRALPRWTAASAIHPTTSDPAGLDQPLEPGRVELVVADVEDVARLALLEHRLHASRPHRASTWRRRETWTCTASDGSAGGLPGHRATTIRWAATTSLACTRSSARSATSWARPRSRTQSS